MLLLQFIQKSFTSFKRDAEIFFKFEEDDGSIELVIDTEQNPPSNGWTIIPHTSPIKVSYIASYYRLTGICCIDQS